MKKVVSIQHRTKRRSLLPRDDTGSSTYLGLFAAAISISAMFYVASIGDAVDHEAAVAAGADSGAVSSAVTLARVMNMVALVSTSMLAITSVISGLKAVESLLLVAFNIAWYGIYQPGCKPPPTTWGCWAQWPSQILDMGHRYTGQVIDRVKPYVGRIKRMLGYVAKVMDTGIFPMIQAKVMELVQSGFQNVAVGFVHQFIPDLPYSQSPCDYLCSQSSGMIGNLPWGLDRWPIQFFTGTDLSSYDTSGDSCGGDDSPGIQLSGDGGFGGGGCTNGSECFMQRMVTHEPNPNYETNIDKVSFFLTPRQRDRVRQVGSLRELAEYSVSQSESFFWDSSADEQEMTYNQCWTTRITAFQLDSSPRRGLPSMLKVFAGFLPEPAGRVMEYLQL